MQTGVTPAAGAVDLSHHHDDSALIEELMRPLQPGWRFWTLFCFFALGFSAGVVAFIYECIYGLGIWGMSRNVFWAFDITNFVFWIGLSHSGTLISAILRLTASEWRRPITRGAEAMTLFTVCTAGLFPIIHLGRPWLFYWITPYPNERTMWPNFRSPLAWDLFAILTYITGSLLYLYIPMVPDLAILRDRTTGWRHHFYRVLALGWKGTDREWSALIKGITIMAALVTPIAVSVHSIVSWDFATSVTNVWHTTIFAPYFVIGAIFSGTALVITIMVLLRWVYKCDKVLQDSHFDRLGQLLLLMSCLWGFFYFGDMILAAYKREPVETNVLESMFFGDFSPFVWTMIFCNFFLTAPLLSTKRGRTNLQVMMVVSILVNIGMWLERFLIIVPTLSKYWFPNQYAVYFPSIAEIAIFVGSLSFFPLLYLSFVKLFPIFAIWEIREEMEVTARRAIADVEVPVVAKL